MEDGRKESHVHGESQEEKLIEQAHREQRILLPEDKDFGWLVHVSHADSSGVILIRFPGNARRTLFEAVMQIVEEQGERLLNTFVVVQPGHVRISHRPDMGDREDA